VKVLALVPGPYDTTPGQRFRIEQWEPYLRAEGIAVEFAPFLDARAEAALRRPGGAAAKAAGVLRGLGRRLRLASTAPGWDLIFVYREAALIGPALVERLLDWRGAPFVLDFDDAIWMPYVSPANALLGRLRFPGKTATLCRMARRVVVGNEYLGEYARRHNPHVSVVPTTIDTDRYRPRARPANPVPVIGWMGSYSTARYLDLVKPVLRRLRERREFRMTVVGGGDVRIDGVDVETRPWTSAREVEDLLGFDVGLMPLHDTEWEKGKCGAKALQYMALEVPCVVSRVGVNSEIVQDGVNGFTVANENEWERALERLVDDAGLRQRLGQAARETVVARYSAKVHAPRVAEILREAAR
jgi:glycosyltransferase involved in cell wall biosynthesis